MTPRSTPRWPIRCRWRCWCCSRASRPSSAPCCCCTTCSTTRIAEIAEIIGKSEDNVRQLATRARRHVEQRRPRFQTTREQRDELARRFFAAAEQGDLAGLEALLASDVKLTGDGGGKVPALARSLHGRSRVAHTLVSWLRQAARSGPVAAPRRSQRRPGSALSRRTAAGDRRRGARYRRRRDPEHQLHRQPRQADPPRAGRRLGSASAISEMKAHAIDPSRFLVAVLCRQGPLRRLPRPA